MFNFDFWLYLQVTVLIKHNHCSERKKYQATFDEVPGMFSDGSTTAGNVYIETIVESEHVKLHFPYLMTTIDVIKVIIFIYLYTSNNCKISMIAKWNKQNISVL